MEEQEMPDQDESILPKIWFIIVIDDGEDGSEGEEGEVFIDPSQLSPEELNKLIEEHPEMAEQILAAMGMEEGDDEDESEFDEGYSEGMELMEGEMSEYSEEEDGSEEVSEQQMEPGQKIDQVYLNTINVK